MSIVLQGSTSGSVTLQEPAVAGTTTINLPASSGTALVAPTALTVPNTTGTVMVSGNMPAFSAYQSTSQTPSSNVFTKLQFQTEEFDTANCFDSTTNYRFTPNVAGYYQVNGGFSKPSGATEMVAAVYKNGSDWKRGSDVTTTSSAFVNCIVYLNGSTDYIELYGYMATGANTWNNSVGTYFQAVLVRGA
jgi:hypothetical protein